MAVSVAYALNATITETIEGNTDSASEGNRRVTHSLFNESGTIDGDSTPGATKQASFVQALTDGSATVDLTNLTGTNGVAVDGTGLRVQLIRVKNLGAATLTIVEGTSNGYDGLGSSSSITLGQNGVCEILLQDAGGDISGTNKTLDLSGTGTQTSEWTVVMG